MMGQGPGSVIPGAGGEQPRESVLARVSVEPIFLAPPSNIFDSLEVQGGDVELLKAARHSGILAVLSDADLTLLCRSATQFGLTAKSELRTDGKGVYVIVSGEVDVFLEDASARLYPLSHHAEGEVFGELSLFLTDRPASDGKIYVQARTDLEIVRFDPQVFRDCVIKNPEALHYLLVKEIRSLRDMNEYALYAVTLGQTEEHQLQKSLRERLTDGLNKYIASWWFVVGLAGTMAVYVTLNTMNGIWQFDRYPFQFLNLMISAVSGFTPSIVLIGQNRQSEKAQAELRAMAIAMAAFRDRLQALDKQNKEQTKLLERLVQQGMPPERLTEQ